jgi:phospholipase/lecithinase/hemolysin
MNKKFLRHLLVTAAFALSSAVANAASYTSITFFGDSLSDTGNVFLATGGAVPAAPYFNGRFSNGLVWTEYLAISVGLGSSATASLMGGNNYAFGGARTGTAGSPPGVLAQAAGLWAPAHPGGADPGGLYVVVGGGNDLRDARLAFQTNSAADQAGRQAAAMAAATNLISVLSLLASQGAQHVLLANLPDLGQTPEAVGLGLVASSSDATARFNALLPTIAGAGASFGLNVNTLDLFGLQNLVMNDALFNGAGIYGITNVFTPCGSFPGSIGISCNLSLFSDALHPSGRAHQLIGEAAFAALVPVPAAIWLFGSALGVMGWMRRKAAA